MTSAAIAPQDLASQRYYWEDLQPGMEFETVGRTITTADIGTFAGLSGDYNRLHTDAAYAADTQFGQCIAHGLLVGSVMSGLNTRTVMNQFLEPSIRGLLEMSFRFPKPVFAGDTIRTRIIVKSCDETSNPRQGVVAFERLGINQHGDTVCICLAKLLVARRNA